MVEDRAASGSMRLPGALRWGLVALALVMPVCASLPAAAQDQAGQSLAGFWRRISPVFVFRDPPGGEAGPINDIRGNQVLRAEGSYAHFLGDYNNPILQPWAAAQLKTRAEKIRAFGYNPDSSDQAPAARCMRSGVPNIWTIGGAPLPLQFYELENKVLINWGREYRIIRLNAEHPARLEPTWYGDSVGHWEGDTLIVDTVGQRPDSPTDIFGTPHSDQIHVVERFRRYERDGERFMQVHFTVNDPIAFTRPWGGVVDFLWFPDALKRPEAQRGDYGEISDAVLEYICAENNRNPNTLVAIPINDAYTYPE